MYFRYIWHDGIYRFTQHDPHPGGGGGGDLEVKVTDLEFSYKRK